MPHVNDIVGLLQTNLEVRLAQGINAPVTIQPSSLPAFRPGRQPGIPPEGRVTLRPLAPIVSQPSRTYLREARAETLNVA